MHPLIALGSRVDGLDSSLHPMKVTFGDMRTCVNAEQYSNVPSSIDASRLGGRVIHDSSEHERNGIFSNRQALGAV